jgi:predicted GIY-YIG superfamily endonuclease
MGSPCEYQDRDDYYDDAPRIPDLDSVPYEVGVYVLELSSNKFYIGSGNLRNRIQAHFDGTANVDWTNLYPPVRIEFFEKSISRAKSRSDERYYTLHYMLLFGPENVRGGPFTQRNWTNEMVDRAREGFADLFDLCRRCYRGSHFVSNCYSRNPAQLSDVIQFCKEKEDL